MAAKNAANLLELSSFASAGMAAGYQVIDAAGTEKSCYLLRIINDTTRGITISFDGSTDHFYMPAAWESDFPAQNNAQPPNWVALWSKGTKVYVKGTAGTGSVYLTGFYVER